MEVSASLEIDGFIFYAVKTIALRDVEFSNVAMRVPFSKQEAKYMMGLGEKVGIVQMISNGNGM